MEATVVIYTLAVFIIGWWARGRAFPKIAPKSKADEIFFAYTIQTSELISKWGDRLPDEFCVAAAVIVEPMIEPIKAETARVRGGRN